MSTTSTAPTRLSDEDVARVIELLKDSDSVELKLTVPESAQRSTATALGLDPLEAQIRQVFFFDTPDLRLNQQGVVVRARRVQRKGDDTVVKLRPVEPTGLPKRLRRSDWFGVEVDAMPGGFVCSGSMKGAPSAEVRAVLTGQRPLRKLFSKEQRAFYAEHAPEDVALDDLTMLGPIFVLKLKSQPKDFERDLVSELWLYPDGSRVLELSTKCAPSQAFQVAAEARAYLSGKGVDLEGAQETKTRRALEYFATELAPAGEERASE
jgi:hypothetical protein